MPLLNEIEELQKKAANYDRLKEEHERLKNSVTEAIESLKSIDIVTVKPRAKLANFIAFCYEELKIKDELIITKDKLIEMAKETNFQLKPTSINWVLISLSKMPNIERSKEGRKISLFYRKRESLSESIKKFNKNTLTLT